MLIKIPNLSKRGSMNDSWEPLLPKSSFTWLIRSHSPSPHPKYVGHSHTQMSQRLSDGLLLAWYYVQITGAVWGERRKVAEQAGRSIRSHKLPCRNYGYLSFPLSRHQNHSLRSGRHLHAFMPSVHRKTGSREVWWLTQGHITWWATRLD